MAVLHMNFLSRSLGFQTNITVCIPSLTVDDAIARKQVYTAGMKYQVLYLLHGGSGDDQDYLHHTNIARYSEENKVVVVMPNGYNSRYTDVHWGPRYLQFITEELPLVCKTFFPISDKREDTFIAGLSMGGNGTMKAAIKNPEQYCAALCMSGAAYNPETIKTSVRHDEMGDRDDPFTMPTPLSEMIYGDLDKFKGSIHDAWHHAKKNIEENKPMPRFFFAAGDIDSGKFQTDEASEYLHGLGYETWYKVYPGYGHEWDLWDLILRDAFKENWLNFKREPIMP